MDKRTVRRIRRNVLGSALLLFLAACALLLVGSSVAFYTAPQVDEAHAQRSKRNVDDQRDQLSEGGGAVYTRWGRTVCHDDDQLVYAGVVGGSLSTHTGGGSNLLCLSQDPQFGNIVAGTQNLGIIYGAEYEWGANKFGSFSNANADALHNHNVPCAVCRVPAGHRISVMIPGRQECYGEWSKRYGGYLVTGHYTHKSRSEFVCMDDAPEADEAGYRDENGVLFYQVEGACGSLPCPPYDGGKELTCVVCSI